MERMIHRMLTTSIIPQRYATTHLTVFTFRAGQHWSRAVLCDDMQASLQPSEAVVPSYPWRCTIVVFQCAKYTRYTRCTRDRGFPHQMWRGSHQRRKPPLIQKQLFRHFLATIDTSSLFIMLRHHHHHHHHHAEASSTSSKYLPSSHFFATFPCRAILWFLLSKPASSFWALFPWPNSSDTGTSTFFRHQSFPVEVLFFRDQIFPFPVRYFFWTKFVRLLVPVLFSGPNFSVTGPGTFFRDQIFPAPGPVPSKKEQNSRGREFSGPGCHTLVGTLLHCTWKTLWSNIYFFWWL